MDVLGYGLERRTMAGVTGNVEKSRQRRSRHFAVLTYYEYAPRVKRAAALPVEGRVLARLGWAGQTTDFLNIPSH